MGMLERMRDPREPDGVADGAAEAPPSLDDGALSTKRRNWSLFMVVRLEVR